MLYFNLTMDNEQEHENTSVPAPVPSEHDELPYVAVPDATVEQTRYGDVGDIPPVHEYDGGTDDVNMHGGYASVNAKRVRETKLVWLVVIVMSVLCIVVGVCSALITAHFMRGGEQPPNIVTSGEVQQQISAVVRARENSIAEINCGGLRGSGIVTERDGADVYLLTNAHVIERYVTNPEVASAQPSVRFAGEDKFFAARVIGYDLFYDVAVLSVNHETRYTVYDLMGSEYFTPDTSVRTGDYLVSIGNAMGMGIAAHDGIVSRTSELLECNELFGKTSKKYVPVLRTTAVVNAGMSGGGVFDMQGKLVGMGTYRMSNSNGIDSDGDASTDVEDTGFAVPSSVLYPLYKRIRNDANGGAVGIMRVSTSKPNGSAIGGVGLPLLGFYCVYEGGRLKVSSLDTVNKPNSIIEGDYITEIGGVKVTDNICDTIGMLLRYHTSGDGASLVFTVERDGGSFAVKFDGYKYAI